MNIKKITALLCAVVMVLSLAACGSNGDKAENKHYTVGICQLVQHEALDAATQGFIDALNEALPGQVEFQNKNASGDNANCSTIVNGFVSDGVDLIMANATGALTAAVGWSIFSWAFSAWVSATGSYGTYGSLVTVVVVMLWLYYCQYILLLSACLNRALPKFRRRGETEPASEPEPSEE